MDEKNTYKYLEINTQEIITPRQEFYSLYTDKQIDDIIDSLEYHHEIPRQYNYFGNGAKRWDAYVKRLSGEKSDNTLNSTIDLLNKNKDFIDSIICRYSSINVVDIGSGNAYPVKEFLKHLLESGKLKRYFALDISPSMLELTKSNIKTWFGDRITFQCYEYDVCGDKFSDLLAADPLNDSVDDAVKLVLVLGGTLSNMRNPDDAYRSIRDSMRTNDVLIHVTKLDTEASRSYFDFGAPSETTLSANHQLIFELLNIGESFYDIEMGYAQSIKERYIRIRLKLSIKIDFLLKRRKRYVLLRKNDTVLVWRAIQHSTSSLTAQFSRNGFQLLHMSQHDDENYILSALSRN